LVEHWLPKPGVVGSSPIVRSTRKPRSHGVSSFLRVSGELAATSPLVVGINTNDLDDSHSLVEGVEGDGHEADRTTVRDSDEGIAVVARTTRPDLFGLSFLPVRFQPKEDRVAKNLAQRGKDGIPCTNRELHDRVEIALLERPDLDRITHRDRHARASEGIPLLVVAAIVMAVALWLLMRFVFNPLDAKPGA
jgi:hypothetical protein